MASVAHRLVLASQSPARLALLRSAGIEPHVVVSEVDEDEIVDRSSHLDTGALVVELARAKAEAVARRDPDAGHVVVGCDSMFVFGGTVWGKPSGPEEAVARIRSMRGGEGELLTGHHVVDLVSGGRRSGLASTTVRFGPMTDAEIDAYVATGEPLSVAGSFTLDGRSAPFVEGVVGDHTNVIGLSLPLLRSLLADLGRSIVDFW
jgi:septum formation protein